ncbi:MAG: tol-pal system protein YbgF [Hyphomicrobiaceae bacterium]|nr:tol-pal system protein YbgF [Hyphomicrobiaceae bacterium]
MPVLAAVLAGLAAQPAATAETATSKQYQTGIQVAQATAKTRGGDGGQGVGGGLQRHVEQLEEQLVDMQVTIGTLESLARSGGGGRASGGSVGGAGFGPSEAARLEGMETQIRALTAEVQRLTGQMRSNGGGYDRGGGSYDRGDAGGGSPASSARARAAPQQIPSGFGSTTVTPGGDPIGTLLDGGNANQAPAYGQDTQVAALPPVSSGNAKQDYETAYAYLLRQDYGAAEAAFEDFLKQYPSDALAGNAQYWLGETHFVRGAYKQAAGAFLKGYQTYGKSSKAPDSLLKLAMSLDRLGQKEAACSSFSELLTRFPDAGPHVTSRAGAERRRLACR